MVYFPAGTDSGTVKVSATRKPFFEIFSSAVHIYCFPSVISEKTVPFETTGLPNSEGYFGVSSRYIIPGLFSILIYTVKLSPGEHAASPQTIVGEPAAKAVGAV